MLCCVCVPMRCESRVFYTCLASCFRGFYIALKDSCDGNKWIAPMAGRVYSNGWTLVPILHLEILTSRVGGLGGHFEGGV